MRDMSPDEARAFLAEGRRTAKVATVRADGMPHVVPLWFVVDGDDLVLATGGGTAKVRHLRASPKVAVCVEDDRPPYAFVTVFGEARLQQRPPDLLVWTTRIAARYVRDAQAEAVGRRHAEWDDTLIRVPLTQMIARAEIGG